jgi:ketosteroid isomerase-like protein
MMHIAVAQSKDENAVARSVETLRKAMEDGDKASLEKLADSRLSYGHSSGVLEDKAAFVGNIVSGKSDFVKIDLSGQTITVVGNTATVRHTLDAETNDGGKPGKVHLKILLVWVKEGGQWKLLARQAVKEPVAVK